MNKIAVLIAEDHTIVREGLRMLLETAPDIIVVGEAENGRVAISLCQKLHPDIVLMDIAMPSLNGVEATRIILKDLPDTKVIILSMYPDEEYVFESLDAGALGFLVKQTASDDLLKAIREVNSGQAFFSPSISKTVLEAYRKISKATETKEPPAQRISLTSREREVLQLIAEGCTSKEIAEQLFISIGTVRKHRNNIVQKLDIHDIVGLTRYAIEKGITTKDHIDSSE